MISTWKITENKINFKAKFNLDKTNHLIHSNFLDKRTISIMLNVNILLLALFCEHFMIAFSVNISQSINKHLLNDFDKLRHDTSSSNRYANFRSLSAKLEHDTIRRREKRKFSHHFVLNNTIAGKLFGVYIIFT